MENIRSLSSKIKHPPRDHTGADADANAGLPPGLGRCPIIARHFYGIDPTRVIGRTTASLVADLRFRNKMTVLLAMGNRPVAEMVAEFAVRHGLEAELDQVLDRYLEIPAVAMEATNDRDFPAGADPRG